MEETIETGEQLPAEGAEVTESPAVETDVDTAIDISGDEATAPPKSKGMQKRFDELTREKHDERRRADHLASLLEQSLAAQRQPAPEQKEAPAFQPTRPRPTLAECDYDTESFADKLTDWKLEQRDIQTRQQQEKQAQEQQQQTRQKSFEEKRATTLEVGKVKFPDYVEVISSLPANVMHRNLAASIMETTAPADVAYYLGKNSSEAARISQLDPFRMALELGRIEGKATVSVPPKKASNAPPPINPIDSSKVSSGAEPDPAKDPQGWLTWERARVKALGRRY